MTPIFISNIVVAHSYRKKLTYASEDNALLASSYAVPALIQATSHLKSVHEEVPNYTHIIYDYGIFTSCFQDKIHLKQLQCIINISVLLLHRQLERKWY